MTLTVGEYYPVKVIKFIKTGIVVQVGDNPDDTQLIHISKISKMFVDDVSKFVTIGSTYTAECLSSTVRPFELSLLNMNLKPMVIGIDLANGPDQTVILPLTSREPKGHSEFIEHFQKKIESSFGVPEGTLTGRLDCSKPNKSAEPRSFNSDFESMLKKLQKDFDDKQGAIKGREKRRQKR